MDRRVRKVIRSVKIINGKRYVQYTITLPKEFGDRLLADEVKILQHDSFLIIIPSTLSVKTALELILREIKAEMKQEGTVA